MSLQRFERGQRVVVHVCGDDEIELPAGTMGTVTRPRVSDNGAWVSLDHRSDVPNVHPFPADDSRGTHVLCYPVDCDAAPADQVVTP